MILDEFLPYAMKRCRLSHCLAWFRQLVGDSDGRCQSCRKSA